MGHGELIGIFWKKKIRENLTTFVKKKFTNFLNPENMKGTGFEPGTLVA
jgi:hypothetical protein